MLLLAAQAMAGFGDMGSAADFAEAEAEADMFGNMADVGAEVAGFGDTEALTTGFDTEAFATGFGDGDDGGGDDEGGEVDTGADLGGTLDQHVV